MISLLCTLLLTASPTLAPDSSVSTSVSMPTPNPSTPAFDAEHATLEQLLSLTDQVHTDIQLAQLQKLSVEQDARGAFAFILPRVDLTANAGGFYSAPQTAYNTFPTQGSNGQLVFQVEQVGLPGYAAPTFNLGLLVTQPIYDGGRWWTAIDKGRVDTEAAAANLAEARLQAHVAVAHAFFELVRAERSLKVLETNVQRSQDQVTIAEARFDAGRGPKSDIFAAKVNLANDQIAVVQQKSTLDLTRSHLNALLGRDPQAPLGPVPPDLSARPELAPREQLQNRADTQRPALNLLRRQAESAQLATRIARADYFPNVNVTAGYSRNSPNPALVVGNPTRQYVAQGALNLTWNLFAGHTTEVNVEKAHIAEDSTAVNLEKSRRALHEEVERAARGVEAQTQSELVAEQAHTIAQEGLSLAEERFKGGLGTTVDIRDAQLKLTQSELVLLSNQIDLQLAAVDLHAAMGEL
jgi:outer membrane protein TolC